MGSSRISLAMLQATIGRIMYDKCEGSRNGGLDCGRLLELGSVAAREVAEKIAFSRQRSASVLGSSRRAGSRTEKR